MARAHCDNVIRPSYVREVCRLLRNSNINISKQDIEFETIQDEINRDLQKERENQVMQSQPSESTQQPSKKVKISFEEYQKLSLMIVQVMKVFEAQGQENVQQSDIINRMV